MLSNSKNTLNNYFKLTIVYYSRCKLLESLIYVLLLFLACYSRQIIDHLKALVSKNGTDCWWSLPINELLPTKLLREVPYPIHLE